MDVIRRKWRWNVNSGPYSRISEPLTIWSATEQEKTNSLAMKCQRWEVIHGQHQKKMMMKCEFRPLQPYHRTVHDFICHWAWENELDGCQMSGVWEVIHGRYQKKMMIKCEFRPVQSYRRTFDDLICHWTRENKLDFLSNVRGER